MDALYQLSYVGVPPGNATRGVPRAPFSSSSVASLSELEITDAAWLLGRRFLLIPSANLIGPPSHEHLAVPIVPWAEREEVKAARPGLESASDLGSDSDRVERLKLYDLVVQLYAPGASEDDIDLLGAPMLVREGLTLLRLDAVVTEAGVLRIERILCESRLLDIAKP